MRSRLLSVFAVGFLGLGAAVVACVGDSGNTIVTGSDGGGDGSPSSNDAGPATSDGSAAPDSGSATNDAGVDAGPPAPVLLGQKHQLALWLEGSASNLQVSGGNVGTWTDLSENHNDATAGSTAPLVDPGAVNQHDAVAFTSQTTTMIIADSTTLQFGQDDVLIAAVVKQTTATASGYLWSKATYKFAVETTSYVDGLEFLTMGPLGQDGGGVAPFVDTAAQISNDAQNELVEWGTPVFTDTKFHRIAVRRTNGGATLLLYVDDLPARMHSIDMTDLGEVGNNVTIGGYPGTLSKTSPLSIEIAELIVVHAPSTLVTDNTANAVQAYLKGKYGL